MTERFNVGREVERILSGTREDALRILPALAGDAMADGDRVIIDDLRDALAQQVFRRGPNHEIANAVLAMMRTQAIHEAAHFNKPLQ